MHPMQRKDKEVTNWNDIMDIVARSEVLRLALFDGQYPYIVPLYFGYSSAAEGRLTLYVHGALAGRKHTLICQNGNAGFEMEASRSIVWNEDDLSDNTVPYESIIGCGTMRVVEDAAEKEKCADIFMRCFRKGTSIDYPKASLGKIQMYELTVTELSVKRGTT